MSMLLSVRELSRHFGARPLFEGLSFGVQASERVGLVGPNGSGKSTVLRILAGSEQPDAGERSLLRGLRLAHVAQEEVFPSGATAVQIAAAALVAVGHEPHEAELSAERRLRLDGWADPHAQASALSGGWRKRLAVTAALLTEPQLLLLDEPTNHLDLEGVLWLERLLQESEASCVVVSHDRAFLDAVATRIIEINPRFPDGHYSSSGGYAEYLETRAIALAGLEKQQSVLANTVTREIAWLRRNPKAQMKKAASRVAVAEGNIDKLAELSWRNRQGGAVRLDVAATGRATQDLLVATGLSAGIGGRTLVAGLDLRLGPGVRVGLLGRNGSGKSTLLRTLSGELPMLGGKLKRAVDLRAVYFRQDRSSLDHKATLRQALCPNGESVEIGTSRLHVMAWARRLGFRPEQMEEPVGRLSGGEQARLLISQLVQRPADLLMLDEPTNDLDVATLEVLEEAITSFPGAVVLVSHDRFLLDRVSTELIALDGLGGATRWADYWQWQQAQERILADEAAARRSPEAAPASAAARPQPNNALSKSERRELERIEEKIAAAEQMVTACDERMQAVATDAAALTKLHAEREAAQAKVDTLYARWQELEAKAAG